jgi:hypothetical protein
LCRYVMVKNVADPHHHSYGRVAADLPAGANAGGIRPGTCNMLAFAMPNEFVLFCTGHVLTAISALFEYLDADVANAMVGAVVLANWPPFSFGKRGKGPVPADLVGRWKLNPVDP